jgi:ATP-dependent Clp protease adaptor protein ClpS
MARRPQEDSDTAVDTRTEKKVAKPRMWKVLLHNDHYTTREFVVAVLVDVFNKSETDAVQIMKHVHTRGVGVAGVYTHDVAQTKIDKVHRLARAYEYPLKLSMEPEDD